MENMKLNKEEIVDLIFYAIKKNELESKSIDGLEIRKIINKYCDLCTFFVKHIGNGELDTFERAACLMIAINRSRLFSDKRFKASIAADAAYKMCEKPYWNVGENHGKLIKMEEVDFNGFSETHRDIYDEQTKGLIDCLIYNDCGELSTYSCNLQIFYLTALNFKLNGEKLQCEKEFESDSDKRKNFQLPN